ncbi:MAG: asparagine synthase (glutamine-hydrolyzing) [Mariprofundales bacterium]|nr:asparagine synthase (glutamine-hydrolyzing) [Mariprofundales bacterium]
MEKGGRRYHRFHAALPNQGVEMCGIAGIAMEVERYALRDRVERMCTAMRHRGPDGEGCFVDDGIGLGHVRLSIIDLSDAGKQPMSNEDQSVWITVNGEIYNFRELRSELKRVGHRFSSESDSEVIVHLYEEYGEGFPEYLNGMFAIALWDVHKRKLMLVRDRFGIKPLYYSQQPQGLVFASELSALMASGLVAANYDDLGLYGYMAFGYLPTPKTVYKTVMKLRPAESLVFEDGASRTRRYWRPKLCEVPHRYEEAVEVAEELLERSVTEHLVSDVPVASFLSGGVDSSLISALARRHQPLVTVCAAFPGSQVDESSTALEVANHLNTEHQTVNLGVEHEELYRRVLSSLDEPFADSSAMPTYAVCGAGRRVAKVMLSGDGGDEVFGGYTGRYRVAALKAILPAPALLAKMLRQLPPWRSGRRRSLPEMLDIAALNEQERYVRERQITTKVQRREMFGPAQFAEGEAWLEQIADDALAQCDYAHPVHRALWMDLSTSLADDMLTKVDRVSMAHGLEVRVPLLDHRLVEFALSLPSKWLVSPRAIEGKRILRDVTAPLLPKGTIDRPKQGFVVPLNNWLNDGLKKVWGDVDQSIFEGKIDVSSLAKSWGEGHQGARQDIYAMLTLGLWMQQRKGDGL